MPAVLVYYLHTANFCSSSDKGGFSSLFCANGFWEYSFSPMVHAMENPSLTHSMWIPVITYRNSTSLWYLKSVEAIIPPWKIICDALFWLLNIFSFLASILLLTPQRMTTCLPPPLLSWLGSRSLIFPFSLRLFDTDPLIAILLPPRARGVF